jgi:hypothetical protein
MDYIGVNAAGMSPWTSCSLDEEILSILEEDAPATVRHLCALIYPRLSWQAARLFAADAVRRHCQFLAGHRLLREVEEDTYAPVHIGSA